MSELAFISDVIYGLKQEYPFTGTIKRDSVTVPDLKTGLKVTTQVYSIYIGKMIRLPFSWRKYIAQKAKGSIQEVGVQEILIDKKDLSGQEILVGDYISARGKRLNIGEIEDYEYAYIAHVKAL